MTIDAASIVTTSVQGLADRTRYLVELCGGVSGLGEFEYVAPRNLKRVISPFAMQAGLLSTTAGRIWTAANFTSGGTGYSLTSQVNFALLLDDVSRYLPIIATLTGVEVMVGPGAARATVGDRMTVTLARQTPNWITPAIPVAVGPIFTATDDGSTSVQVISSGAISEAVGRTSDLVLRIAAGNDAGTNKDDVHAIRLSYTVNGPDAF